MYSPALSRDAVKTLYRIRRVYRKPMTEIAEELIQHGLRTVDKEFVCKVCASERNNDCNNCYLVDGRKRKEVMASKLTSS